MKKIKPPIQKIHLQPYTYIIFYLIDDSESNYNLLFYPLQKAGKVEELWNIQNDCCHKDRGQIPH